MFKLFVPYKAYLLILQLEGYDLSRWWKWWWTHRLVFRITGRQQLIRTHKLVAILALAVMWLLLLGLWRWYFGLLAILFPGVLITLGVISFWPIEYVMRWWLIRKTARRISFLKARGLRVVAVSGSYGKTSVKEYLAHILRQNYCVLRTPENYNSLLGIIKVIEMELEERYDYFICELGAYTAGETRTLCDMLQPDAAILTGLNEQHLERFGTLQREIEGESASIGYVLERGGIGVANMGNALIRRRWVGAEVRGYGTGTYQHPSEQNWEGAALMARQLGVSAQVIAKAKPTRPHIKNRLTVQKQGDLTILDDTYSSNTDGFRAAVDFLAKQPGWRVLVTPGIVELGGETERIHRELGGYIVGKVDQVLLVRKTGRTEALAEGYGNKVEYIESVFDAVGYVKKRPATILYENDLTDNY